MKAENKLSSSRLAEAMSENKLRSVDVCQRTSISKSAMSMYLSGARIPNRDNAEKLSKVLGVNPVWLMGFDVPKRIEDALTDAYVQNKQKELLLSFFAQLTPEKQESVLNLIKTMI